ncbi:MAG: DUF4292 domain-containing protein [Paludibacteraceae bacterium]|nr:DUF4292 domain-containing protein [Paludibacteraceae bacterium]
MLRFIIRMLQNSIARGMRGIARLAVRTMAYCGIEIITMLALGTGFAIGLTGCHTQQVAVQPQPTETATEEEKPWHTCLMQGAKATLTMDGQTITANCTMQVVRDSMLVISVMPMLGIEVYRLEATPEELIAIDKLNHQYLKTDYARINRYVTPSLTWEDLQQIASNEVQGGPFIGYAIGEKTIALKITYPEKQTDVAVRMLHIDLSRYKQVVVENL